MGSEEKSSVHHDNSTDTIDPISQQGGPLAFRLPEFTCPFPTKINPHYSKEESNNWFREWLLSMKVDEIYKSWGKSLQEIFDMEIPYYAAIAHPLTQDVWGHQFYCKLCCILWVIHGIDFKVVAKTLAEALSILLDINVVMMWSFPNDSELIKGLNHFLDMLESPQEREREVEQFEEMLEQARAHPGTVYPGKVSKVCGVFRDMFKDGFFKSSQESYLRFTHACQRWMAGLQIEIQYRDGKTFPQSIDEVLQIRTRSSAIYTRPAAIDTVCGLSSPSNWFYSKPMQDALQAINDLLSWINYIWSFKKEFLMEKHQFNIVFVVSKSLEVPYTEAGKIVINMLNKRILDMEDSLNDLENITPPELHQNFAIYKESCFNVVSGVVLYHKTSSRFEL